jgi:hypothetical protein
MAVTFTPTVRHVYSIGDRKEAIIDIAYSGTPTAGGDTVLPSALGFTQLDIIDIGDCGSDAGATNAYILNVIYPNAAFVASVKLAFMVQVTAGATTPLGPATGALTAGSFRCRVIGKGSVSGASS